MLKNLSKVFTNSQNSLKVFKSTQKYPIMYSQIFESPHAGKYPKVLKTIQKDSKALKRSQKYWKVSKISQRFSNVLKSSQKFLEVLKSIQLYYDSQIFKITHTQKYPKVLKSIQK